MVLIFSLSHQPVARSNNLSKEVTEITIRTVEKIAPEVEFNPRRLNHILRKNAHFFSYLVLGILLMNCLSAIGLKGYRLLFLAFSLSVLYAISDEVHQLFVPGRGGQLRDVFIDSFGAATGILIYKLFMR